LKKITEELKVKLRKPFGKLFNLTNLINELRKRKAYLISVGDVTTFNLLKHNIKPDLAIYDYYIERKPALPKAKKVIKNFVAKEFTVKNKPGTLSKKLFNVLKKIFSLKKKAKLRIKGEEDLAVIPAVLLCRQNALLAYGQPKTVYSKKGIVLMKINNKTRSRVEKIFKAFH